MLEALITQPSPEPSGWEPGDIIRIRMGNDESLGTRILSLGVDTSVLDMRYSNSPDIVRQITSNVISITIPDDVEYVYLNEGPIVKGHPVLRIYGTGVTEVEWSETLQVNRFFFSGASNLVKVSEYLPKTINNIWSIFQNCTAFNQDISMWDTSTVNNMNNAFRNATSFNQDLSGWDVSKVTSRGNFDTGATAWQAAFKPRFI